MPIPSKLLKFLLLTFAATGILAPAHALDFSGSGPCEEFRTGDMDKVHICDQVEAYSHRAMNLRNPRVCLGQGTDQKGEFYDLHVGGVPHYYFGRYRKYPQFRVGKTLGYFNLHEPNEYGTAEHESLVIMTSNTYATDFTEVFDTRTVAVFAKHSSQLRYLFEEMTSFGLAKVEISFKCRELEQ